MDIVISRILKYVNGCLDNNYMYQIGLFVVDHYAEMEDYSLERVMAEGHFSEIEVLDFCVHLGFETYEDFQLQLLADYMLRTSQIRARLLDVSAEQLLEQLDLPYSHHELMTTVETICEFIFTHKRVIVIGALYPTSIAVDFQTDFIMFGKSVIEFHHFDKEFRFLPDDLVIFVSATGRTLDAYLKRHKHLNICDATIVLMTQNIKYRHFENISANHVIHVPGKFDGIQFNYQIMLVFDIIRIYYYQKYYI